MMKTRLTAVAESIVIIAILLSSPAAAENMRFDMAVKVFKQAYTECTEAQAIRSQNINLAMEKFAAYTRLKDKAAQMSPEILTTKRHNISRDILFCKQAEQDILRAKAFPIIEDALTSCKQSKQQLTQHDTASAANTYQRYKELLEKALLISPSTGNISSVSIKIKRCEKLSKKITAAQTEMNNAIAAFKIDYEQVSVSLDKCHRVKTIVKNSPSTKKLAEASKLLSASNRGVSLLISKRNKDKSGSQYASLPINQQISNKLTSSRKCQKLMKTAINKEKFKLEAIKAKRAEEKKAEEQRTSMLKKSKLDEENKTEQKKIEDRKKRVTQENKALRLKQIEEKRATELAEKKRLAKQRADKINAEKELIRQNLFNSRKNKNWANSLKGPDQPQPDDEKPSQKAEVKTKEGERNSSTQRKRGDWQTLIK
ncbi:MAG: hypothetical protein KUG80_05220 [Gammaproteobacteria bacterium]|nr:hypothetical protein [Gammaproteobacteria bacterium]